MQLLKLLRNFSGYYYFNIPIFFTHSTILSNWLHKQLATYLSFCHKRSPSQNVNMMKTCIFELTKKSSFCVLSLFSHHFWPTFLPPINQKKFFGVLTFLNSPSNHLIDRLSAFFVNFSTIFTLLFLPFLVCHFFRPEASFSVTWRITTYLVDLSFVVSNKKI